MRIPCRKGYLCWSYRLKRGGYLWWCYRSLAARFRNLSLCVLVFRFRWSCKGGGVGRFTLIHRIDLFWLSQKGQSWFILETILLVILDLLLLLSLIDRLTSIYFRIFGCSLGWCLSAYSQSTSAACFMI